MIQDLFTLIKPRITLLATITSAVGLALAPGTLSWQKASLALLGCTLLVAGANALNMFLERDTDLLMERTRDRPLPQGRLAPETGILVGSVLIGFALPILFVYVNAMTGFLAMISLGSYVFVYTPLKRKTSLALLIGAVPGAAPPVLGWTSVTATLTLVPIVLFSIMFFWQIPHFLAIGLFRREEYERAGLKILTLEKNDFEIKHVIIRYSIAMVLASLCLIPLQVVGSLYSAVAVVLGLSFMIYAFWGLTQVDLQSWAKKLFVFSLVYLTLLFAVIYIDGVLL